MLPAARHAQQQLDKTKEVPRIAGCDTIRSWEESSLWTCPRCWKSPELDSHKGWLTGTEMLVLEAFNYEPLGSKSVISFGPSSSKLLTKGTPHLFSISIRTRLRTLRGLVALTQQSPANEGTSIYGQLWVGTDKSKAKSPGLACGR